MTTRSECQDTQPSPPTGQNRGSLGSSGVKTGPLGEALELKIYLPALHPGQLEVRSQAVRFNVLAAGRRWGKNVLGADVIIEAALDQALPAAWFSPSYKTLADDWRQLTDVLQPAIRDKNETERRLVLLTGGVIEMWSLDDPNTARGRAYRRVVIDEAASVHDLGYAWQRVIRPMLTDYEGDAWFLSTPNGLNFFHTLYVYGQDENRPDWKSWRRPTAENPHVPGIDVERAQEELPEAVFLQEYMAQFIQDAGGIFRHVTDAATAEPQERALHGHAYIMGVDWGKYNDYTYITIIDADQKALVAQDRFNRIDYTLQVERLDMMVGRFHPLAIVAERNAMGEPIIERLQRGGLPVRPFIMTNESKRTAVEALTLAIEQGTLKILNDPVLIGELQSFQAERLPSGLLRYAAPTGMHDDGVISLALAWSAVKSVPPRKSRGRRREYVPENRSTGY